MDNKIKKVSELIQNNQTFVISTHEKSDADGLGSSIAFYYYLKSLKKNVKIIQPSPFPEECKILDPDNVVETFSDKHLSYIKNSDLIILFDVGHISRAKSISEIGLKNKVDIISFDHHKNDDISFFKTCIIDTKSPATGLIVYKYLKEINYVNWDIKVSNAIYAAIMTDTGSFRYNNTTSECHDIASELIKNGVKPYDIYAPIYENRSMSQIRLLSHVIDSLKFSLNEKVAYAIIDSSSFKKTKSNISDVDGFTEFIRSIQNIEISFLITEQKDGSFRVNFRSKGLYVINDIASKLGGGGHEFAAGCRISNSSAVVIENKILNLLNEKIGNYGNKK
tara:strand:+ start:48 stop:1055 length:1008 start_codon:yes stop_codon:yes gene_type:complete